MVYGEDVHIPHKKPPIIPKPAITHDAAFKPAFKHPASGYNCTISKYPEYKENPMRIILRKKAA